MDAPDKPEALRLLSTASEIVIPIMQKRNWKVKLLCEFAPKDARLLGRNWGRGAKVEIRLRSPDKSPMFRYGYSAISYRYSW